MADNSARGNSSVHARLIAAWRPRLASALGGARNRARRAKKGALPFDLTLPALSQLLVDQMGRCAITGIKFRDELYPKALVKRPFAPSIDRLDPGKGYVIGNIRLVCTAANFARNEWGDTVLRRIAHGIVDTERRQERAWFSDMRRRIRRAEREAAELQGAELARRRHVIAGLKAALTKGPARTIGAAKLARLTQHAR